MQYAVNNEETQKFTALKDSLIGIHDVSELLNLLINYIANAIYYDYGCLRQAITHIFMEYFLGYGHLSEHYARTILERVQAKKFRISGDHSLYAIFSSKNQLIKNESMQAVNLNLVHHKKFEDLQIHLYKYGLDTDKKPVNIELLAKKVAAQLQEIQLQLNSAACTSFAKV